jgi:hypothetical protein
LKRIAANRPAAATKLPLITVPQPDIADVHESTSIHFTFLSPTLSHWLAAKLQCGYLFLAKTSRPFSHQTVTAAPVWVFFATTM